MADPHMAEAGEVVVWRLGLDDHRAACFLRRHATRLRVRVAVCDRDVWKKYLPTPEASRQIDAIFQVLTRDGWTLQVEEGGAPGRN